MPFMLGGGIAESGQFNLNISGNTISNPGTNPSVTLLQGIRVDSGVAAATRSRRASTSARTRSPVERRGEQGLPPASRAKHDVRLPGYAGAARAPEPTPPSPTFVSGKIGGGAQGTRADAPTAAVHRYRDDVPVGVARWLSPFLSEIRIMSFNFPPKGWALCNGQLLPINQNQALFALLGTTYGGNGQTTFALAGPPRARADPRGQRPHARRARPASRRTR